MVNDNKAADRLKNRLKSSGDKIPKKSNKTDKIEMTAPIIQSNNYFDYEGTPFTATKNGERYRANISFTNDEMEKFTYMLFKGGYNSKQRSQLGGFAIDLLYEIYYELKKDDIDILKDRPDVKEIIKFLSK